MLGFDWLVRRIRAQAPPSTRPSWATEPTEEQPTVDPWADEDAGQLDRGDSADEADAARPANRSPRFPRECGTDRGYPSGCRQCGPSGCPLLWWAQMVLAGQWPQYPQARAA